MMWAMLAGLAMQMQQSTAARQAKPVAAAQRAAIGPQLRTAQVKQKGDAGRLLARAQRVQANYKPKAGQPSKAELDSRIAALRDDLDSMPEMGEMESLRLQMAMDRRSKMISMLSNLLKKISDTSQSITQNLK